MWESLGKKDFSALHTVQLRKSGYDLKIDSVNRDLFVFYIQFKPSAVQVDLCSLFKLINLGFTL